jgi:hypothetical protein
MPKERKTQVPSVSRLQHRFMQAAASSPKMAKELGIPQKVAKKYTKETGSMKGLPEKVKKK